MKKKINMEYRHILQDDKLNALYRQLDDFIADLTLEEAQEHLPAFNEVKTLIHQRMRENTEKAKALKQTPCNDCVAFYFCADENKRKKRCEYYKEKSKWSESDRLTD